MKKTYSVIAEGDKKGWIVGDGIARNDTIGNVKTVLMSLDLSSFQIEIILLKVDDYGNVEYNKEAEIFYLENKIKKEKHAEFYHTYLKSLAEEHNFPTDIDSYETKIQESKKKTLAMEKQKDLI